MGDPDRGTGRGQPGGWIFQVSPFLEEESTFKVGTGLSAADKKIELQKQTAHVVPVFNCPTRRRAIALSGFTPSGTVSDPTPYNVDTAPVLAKTDYAINGGHSSMSTLGGGPGFICLAVYPAWGPGTPAPGNACAFINTDQTIASQFSGISTDHTGIKYDKSSMARRRPFLLERNRCNRGFTTPVMVIRPIGNMTMATITRCTKATTGIPIDFRPAASTTMGKLKGIFPDATPIAMGSIPQVPRVRRPSTIRRAWVAPMRAVMNVAFCDGSVQSIEYEIDPLVWNNLWRPRR